MNLIAGKRCWHIAALVAGHYEPLCGSPGVDRAPWAAELEDVAQMTNICLRCRKSAQLEGACI